MKNRFPLFFGMIVLLTSCNVNYNPNYPIIRTYPTGNTNSSRDIDREYNELIKTYKPETAEVLTDLLNDSSDSPSTSITIENKSRCNMVITVSGNNFYKKIPIGAGKIGYTMVQKNQNYKLSGMVCRAVYQTTKFISSSYSVRLSD